MAKEETTKERLKGVETELKGFHALMEQREKTSDQRHAEVVKRLEDIAKNGHSYVTLDTLADAIGAHAFSCPSRNNPGTALKEGWGALKEGWKTLAAVVTLATGLSLILGKLLERVG